MKVGFPHRRLWVRLLFCLLTHSLAPACSNAGPEPEPEPEACASLPDGTSCSDDNPCTSRDECLSGECVGLDPVVCPGEPLSVCHRAPQCDPETGACTGPEIELPDGTPCYDGDVCTQGDRCEAGVCVPPAEPPAPAACADEWCFTDVSVASGIDPGDSVDLNFLFAASAFLDYDADGWIDILVGSATGPIVLFRSSGDGTFEDVSAEAGLALPMGISFVTGFIVADYDNDGFPDIYVTAEGANVLLHNNGVGGFEDVSVAAGVDDDGMGTGGAFGDYDGDGLLDLYLVNYVAVISYPNHTPDPNHLYRNLGDGTFEDVTDTMIVDGHAGTSLSATWFDIEGDGDLDLMVCNDFGMYVEPNRLYRNDGPDTPFVDIAEETGANLEIFCMGTAIGDVDGDLDLDFYMTNIGRNVLLRYDSDQKLFEDASDDFGVDITYENCEPDPLFIASWGAVLRDLNLDGSLDLVVSNGWIPASFDILNSVDSPDSLFAHNRHSNTFSDVSVSAGFHDDGIGRSIALADFDRDGDLDILHHGMLQRPRLLRNDTLGGASVTVKLQGTRSNRDAIGARVIADVQGRRILRDVRLHDGYLASHAGDLIFGLGDADRIDALEIRWPSGLVQIHGPLDAGESVLIVEPN